MPATYLSYEITPDMTLKQKQTALYLGVISAGEQAYTLGEAIAECRKQLDSLDTLVSKMRKDYQILKDAARTLDGIRESASDGRECPEWLRERLKGH
jgi:hypothetical protein